MTRRTLALGFQCIDFFASTHLLARSVGHESFNMVELTDKSAVSEGNHIHFPEDKLKEEQKKLFEDLVEKFKHECNNEIKPSKILITCETRLD